MNPPTTIDDILVAGKCLGFATGVILTCLILTVLRRTAPRQAGRRPSIAVALCILGYSGAGLAQAILILAGVSPVSGLATFSALVNHVSAAIFPVFLLRLIGDVTVFSQAEHLKAERWLLRLSMVNAGLLLAGIAASALVPSLESWLNSLTLTRILEANRILLCALGAWIALRCSPDNSASRNYLVFTVAALAASMTASLIPRILPLPPGAQVLLRIVTGQAPLLIAPAGLLLFGRFRAADVFLKRSLQLCVVVVVAFCYWLAFRRWPLLLRSSSPYPYAVRTIAFCASAAAGWFVLSFLFQRIDRAVERWLLGDFSYRDAASRIWTALVGLDDEPAIFHYLKAELNLVLETEAVAIVRRDSLPAEAHRIQLDAGEAVDLLPGDPVRNIPGGGDVDLLIPVRVASKVPWLITIAAGWRRRGLVASEVAFLRSAAVSLGTRLEFLTAERERHDREIREARLAHLAVQAELRALQAQVNPHFLFNSLNTIAAMIAVAPEKAEEMTVRLAMVFRHVLINRDKQLSAVSEELDFLRTYLQIEEARFGDRLAVVITMDPGVRADAIPTLILQPLVENAIKHGLAPKTGPGNLAIRACAAGGYLRLSVEDDGMGTGGLSNGNGSGGVGLSNVEERLKTFYQGKASLHLETRTGSGTCATILIPREAH